MNIKEVILKYNLEENLTLNYGHKLRGFFANKFKEVLFHQHDKDGSLRYKYPLIQYKIIDGAPVIIGLEEGGELILEYFLDIDKLILGDKEYSYPSGNINVIDVELKVVNKFKVPIFKYTFISPWMGLNQSNYNKYIGQIKKENKEEKIIFLSKILVGNILSFAKGIDWWVMEDITVLPKLREISIRFKGNKMLGFKGYFLSNVLIPEKIGLGKSTSRGFGTVLREKII